MANILITDPTLRDGNHAISHKLTTAQIAAYCEAADKARIPIVEVGHGNGLGASSLQVGIASTTDDDMLRTAKEHLLNAKLSVHVIPGFATINKDLKRAVDLGVDVFRIGCHCSEADTTQQHISFVRNTGREVWGILMMSHMITPEGLRDEALKMESYGAEAIVIMDSSGHFLPEDVTQRIGELVSRLTVPVGFHGHNNLGMAVANSVAAANAGATIIDATARGFGAGAGNTQIEVLVPVLERLGYETGIDLYGVLDAADLAEREIMPVVPSIKGISIVSGMAGVFSGFAKHVDRVSAEYGLDPRDVFFALGKRQVVAGQEDVIIEVALELAAAKKERK
ncbi:MAG TPA: 4-hydroxy-2-oxovalerate aldolase [Capsulimonadaceae bacterium]|jgi:4-hydroxy 2-oxovalerate aldolase